jgi:NAD(P)-dependent dehydrogenase (short-subunit alcohol dehydrogenase family)
MKNAVITGTSSGIGLSSCIALAKAGYRVFAGMRNLAKSDELEKEAQAAGVGDKIELLQLDITDDASVAKAFSTVASEGGTQVLVNNAGLGGATPLEITPLDEHKQLFETNYFGTVRCIQAVLPEMRERGAGSIINVSSVEGRIAVPNQAPYSASKWALECMSEALAHEVKRFGVRVAIVEPGVIMTKIFENSAPATRYDKTSPYKDIMRRNGKMFVAGFKQGTPPEDVANVILDAIQTKEDKLRWPVGADAHSMLDGRSKMSDEEWVNMGDDLSDAEYNELYAQHFDINL